MKWRKKVKLHKNREKRRFFFPLDLTLIADYFKQYIKQTERFLNVLLSEGNQEKLLANVFMDQEFADNLLRDLKSFHAKTLKFADFKAKYIAIIAK